MQVSYYKNMYDLEGAEVPLLTMLRNIRKGTWKALSDKVRKEKAESADGESPSKKNAPCFTVSGTFTPPREDANLKTHTGIGCVDIDEPLTRSQAHEMYKNDPHLLGYFKSISGNWAFVVDLAVTEETAKEHTELMRGYIEYFEKVHGFKVDPTCKNASRLRYVSYDPELVFEIGTTTPWFTRVVQEVAEPLTPQGSVSPLPDEIAYKKVLTKYQSSAGHFGTSKSRHEWVLGLCVWCNRAGIDKAFVYDRLQDYPIPEREWQKEHRRTLNHVYRNLNEWGTHLQPEFYEPDDIRKYPSHKQQILKWFIERKIKYYEERAKEQDPRKEKFLETLTTDILFLKEYYNSTYGKS